MILSDLIFQYEQALKEEIHQRSLPNATFNPSNYYKAMDKTNRLKHLMINHENWTFELNDKYNPTMPGEIPYPVSC